MINKLLFTALLFVFTSNVFSQVPNYIPTSGLVGYWPFNGNANDESGNNLNGSVIGATLTADRNGNPNSAYNFDFATVGFGTQTDEVYIPFSPLFNTPSVSISIWVYQRQYVWSGNTNPPFSTIAARFQYGYSNPNGEVWMLNSGTNGCSAFANSPNINLNSWTHIVSTFENGIGKIYINGQLIDTQNNMPPLNIIGNSGISIGESNQANGYYWPTDGVIDDFALFNRALTPQEITNLYTSTVPVSCLPAYVPTSGLVGYWPFCGNANDESGNGNNGTVNGATLTTDRFGNANSAYSFDGVNDIITLNAIPMQNGTISLWFEESVLNNSNPNNGHPPIGSQLIGQGTGHQPSVTYCDFALGISSYNGGPEYYSFENSAVNSWTDYSLGTVGNNSVWNNIVIVIDGTQLSMYLNGSLFSSTTLSNALLNSGAPLSFGGRYVFQSSNGIYYHNFFKGNLDDICIWTRSLTPTEITQLYTDASVTPPVACTPFLGEDQTVCAGTSITLSASGSSLACPTLPSTLQNGLVGYWPFCGNANDESGNGNNGTVNGASLSTDRFGSVNSAYSFDGLDDLISCSPGLPIGSSPRTLVSWFKTNAGSIQTSQYPDLQQIAGWGNPYGGPVIFNQWVKASSGQGYFESGSGGNQVYSINAVNDNQWHQFVTTYGGPDSKVKIYIDGIAQDSSSNITLTTASSYLGIGNCPFANTPFHGLIDDVSVWDRALSLAEIQALYSQVQPTYSWSPGGFTTSTINVTPTQTTTYACTTTTNGVSCTDSVTVVVNNPTVDLGNDVTACGTSTTLTAPTGYDSYLWSNGGTTNTTTVTSNGTYTCTVTQGGCSASDSIDVVLVPLTINTTNISAAATYTWENNGQTYTSSGVYTGTTVNCETQVLNLTITPNSSTLSLQVFLDGYYINSLNPAAMTAARYNNLVASGSANPGANTDVDVITVELRSPSNLDVVAYSVSPILQTNGSVQCVFPAGALGGSFYIVVKHRAANPLWSANPIILTTSTTYDFANNLGSAYSNGDLSLAPMHTIVSSLYGIWLGELNEDGYLDATDYSNLELDIYASGYLGLYLLDGDLNGDTYVDASDFAVFESNSIYGPYEQRPYAIATNVSIGQSYQGGIVAYILQPGDAGYDANVQHGLIAAPSNQSNGAPTPWGCSFLIGVYGTAIGTGAQNTLDIMNGCSEAGIAARLCGDLVLGGYSDWYLPSKDELNKLYINRIAIGGFNFDFYWNGSLTNNYYWSSTEFHWGMAWVQNFSNGFQYANGKENTFTCVRAVRAF